MEEGRWTGRLTSDYAQRKLAEVRQPDQPVKPQARLRGRALRAAILQAIDAGHRTHSAIGGAVGYGDEENAFCDVVAAMIAGKEITFHHTGREVFSAGARGMVEERIYRRVKK
jgi:hypothetical protein